MKWPGGFTNLRAFVCCDWRCPDIVPLRGFSSDSAGRSAKPVAGQNTPEKTMINLTGDICRPASPVVRFCPCHARVYALVVEASRRRMAWTLHGIAIFYSSGVQSLHPNQNVHTSMLLFAPFLNRFGKEPQAQNSVDNPNPGSPSASRAGWPGDARPARMESYRNETL
jgi:hypothetical protein